MRSVPPSLSGGDAVLDRVLDQGLQQHGGNARGARRGRDLALDAQAFGEPQRLERQVVVHHLELAFERDEILVSRRQRVAQRARELGHGIPRARGLIGDQRAQSVQRIEQEVRIELRLQQPQLRGLQRFAELCLAQLGVVAAALHGEGQVDGDPRGVEQPG